MQNTLSSINYYSEFRDFNLVFLNTYHQITGKIFKHVKRANFSTESKLEYLKIKKMIEEFIQNQYTKRMFFHEYTNVIRGIDYAGYETEDEEQFKQIDANIDYLNYVYLFSKNKESMYNSINDIGISIAYANNGTHTLDLAVVCDENTSIADALFEELFQKLSILKQKKNATGRINFICQSHSGLYLRELKLKNNTEFDLDLHYNDDFKEISQKIEKELDVSVGKGIILLHGKHGTGKTSYLRHLIQKLKKNIIYVAPDMSHRVSEPAFLTFLLKHTDAVLIIEDAENIIKSREAGENQAVSNLLNITDGILGDGLNFQVICTFNTGFEFIDPALKRKGRMIAQYEFTDLDKDKTAKLVHKLYGDNINPTTPRMTLAEIFNMEDDNYDRSKSSNPIGF